MSVDAIIWVIAIIVFAIVEAATAGLVSIWFVLGSVAALICALLKGPLWLQLIWFVVISVAALIATRPLAKKYVNGKRQPTNADRSIGRVAVVTERIDTLAATGAVQLDGVYWTARSASGECMEVGAKAVILEIQGVKLIVEPAENQ